jgi:hypothetical protein
MHIEVLTEEPSAEQALLNLLPMILGHQVAYRLIIFQGKTDLLSKLPSRLRGYASWVRPQSGFRVVVLVDADDEDCRHLKQRLEGMAAAAGLSTKSNPQPDGTFCVLNRIAVAELEAWFFGDVTAIQSAYPRVSSTLGRKRGFRNPDAIRGGTWEALERVLQKAGYHRGGLAKIQAARKISAHMDPNRNRSRSFQVFRDGLLSLRLTENQP